MTAREWARLALITGIALLGAGLFLGLLPASYLDFGISHACGSPWIADQQPISGVLVDDTAAQCSRVFGVRGVFGGVLAGLGLLALLGVGLVRMTLASRREPLGGQSVGGAPADGS